MNRESYTSASVFPSKLLHQKVIEDGKIIPMHLQISPTNACNLNCSFCSCGDRDKKKQLSLEQITEVIDVCAERGTKAITWTGGGSPLMHPKINEMLDYASSKGIQSSLVTNGILLNRLYPHNNLTWCRISSSDDRELSKIKEERYMNRIKCAQKINPKTDFAFSYVLTKNPNYNLMGKLINFANKNNFTHVRIVSDLCDLDNVQPMDELKMKLKCDKIDDNKVIYQGRKDSTKGTKDCYISLLKPVICPEGIFGCCGIQYAIHGQPRDMIDKLKMGELKDLPKIIDKQKYFDGSVCDTCFYSEYNSALSKLKNRPEHLEFV